MKLQFGKNKSVEFEVPDILKPEIPVISMLKRMSDVQIVTVIVLSDHGRTFEICDMKLLGDWLFDDFKHIRYMVQHQSIDLSMKLTSGKPYTVHAYIVDKASATTIELDMPENTVKGVMVDGKEVKRIEAPQKINGYDIKANPANLSKKDLDKLNAVNELADCETMGTTLKIIPDESLIRGRANAHMWASFLDNHDAADTYAPPNNWGYVAIGFVGGFLFGGALLALMGVIIGVWL